MTVGHALACRVAILLLAAPLLAQQQPNIPHAGYVYPAGGRRGTTLEVTVGGQFLNGASEAYVSGTGVTAIFKRYVRPMTPAEANTLREQMQKLNAQPSRTPEEIQTVAEIRQKLMAFQRRTANVAIAENAILEISIAPDAAPGPREIRIGANLGITNPVAFCVGLLPEIDRPPAKVEPAYNVVNGATAPNRAAPTPPAPPMDVTLPVTLNGQMMPATSDRYRFQATKGQRIVAAVTARELIPYISDAVPGWFQAALSLRDGNGNELATSDHYRFHPDPVLFYEIPKDGPYTLEIHDSIFRGREDFVYRIALGELPYLSGIFPLGAKTGSRVNVEAQGWNLPSARIAQNTKGKAAGIYMVGERASNTLPFAVDSLPETVAKETSVRRDKAQRVKLPIVVEGRIQHPGATQFFRFDGKPGEEIVAEVTARRLQSPLDSVLRLFDSAGRQLAMNDDFDDKGAGLLTHQADSLLSFKLPAKGAYYIEIADVQHNGGPEYAYRLRISHPRPDFELRVVPSSLNVRSGTNVPVTVYALRRDGFSGEIALKLKDVPAGFTLSGGAIPAGQDKVRMTLAVPPGRVDVPMAIKLEGRAEIDGGEVRRTAIPAEDMMQAFAYYHLVPETAWMVRVLGAAGGRMAMRATSEKTVRLPAGGTAPIELFVPAATRLAGVQFTLDDPPEGISIQKVSAAQNGVSVLLRAAPDKVKAGLRGNLILDAFVERAAPAAGAQARRRQLIGALPAIPFEVVP